MDELAVRAKMQPGDKARDLWIWEGKGTIPILVDTNGMLNLEEMSFAHRYMVEIEKLWLRCEISPDVFVWYKCL